MTGPQFGRPRFGAPRRRIAPPEPSEGYQDAVQHIVAVRAERAAEPDPKPRLPLDRPSGMPAHPDTTEADRAWMQAQRANADAARAAQPQPNSAARILAARGHQLMKNPHSEEQA